MRLRTPLSSALRFGAPRWRTAAFSQQQQHSSQLTVGPILGKVGQSSARILVELPCDAEVQLEVRQEGEREAVVVRGKAQAGRPLVLRVEGLRAGTAATYSLPGLADPRGAPAGGRFTTFAERVTKLRLAAFSCNLQSPGNLCKKTGRPMSFALFEPMQRTLWKTLGMMSHDLDLLVHNGDVVYAQRFDPSCAYAQAVSLALAAEEEEPEEEVLERLRSEFRKEYRNAWRDLAFLASVPYMCVMSDGEVCNDWNSVRPSPPKLVLQAAIEVYREYCRALWDDDWSQPYSAQLGDFSISRFGDITLVALDTRVGRHPYLKAENCFLTAKQWDVLEAEVDALSDGGMLMIISETPVAQEPSGDARSKAEECPQVADYWSTHEVAMLKLLDMVRRKPEQILLVCGDCHESYDTTIQDADTSEKIVRQVTSSPLTQFPVKLGLPTQGPLDTMGRYKYVHDASYPGQNTFAIIDVDSEKRTFDSVFVSRTWTAD